MIINRNKKCNIKINDKTKYEIPTVINYLKSKGYEISNLNDLIKE